MKRDIIVIGAGAAGRSAALEAARCGLRVLLVAGGEDALLRASAARGLRRVHSAVAQALTSDGSTNDVSRVRLDLASLMTADVRDVLMQLSVRERNIQVDSGRVELSSPRSVRLADGSSCEAPLLVVATDGYPRRPAQLGFDDHLVCDAESVWLRAELPRSAVVLGADAEGCAVACLLGALGVPVTLIDRRSRSLRYVDREVLEGFHASVHDLGVELVLSEDVTSVQALRNGPDQVVVSLASGRREICDALVVAGGREAGTAALRLDRASVETDARGFVLADDSGRTSQQGVFAVGRAVSEVGPYLDEHLGRAVVRTALGLTGDGAAAVPLVVESLPEIAMVGLTAEMCRHLDVPCIESTAALDGHRAGGAGARGLLKLVVHHRSKTLLGVQVLGFAALEVVQLGCLLVAKERSVRELLGLAAPEVSFYTAYSAAARDALLSTLPMKTHAPA